MVHLRYFKCNGRTNESASSLAIGPLTSSLTTGRISSEAAKSNENGTSKPVSPNIANSSSTNQLLINSNRPIHTVSASDGQVVRIVRKWFSNLSYNISHRPNILIANPSVWVTLYDSYWRIRNLWIISNFNRNHYKAHVKVWFESSSTHSKTWYRTLEQKIKYEFKFWKVLIFK